MKKTFEYPSLMTVKEVAKYLRFNEITIYRLSNSGEIPAIRVASRWRFKKESLDLLLGGSRRK